MIDKDIRRLEELDQRYSEVNLTGFKLVSESTTKETVLKHLEWDLRILNTCDVDYKFVLRVMLLKDSIDIGAGDNGTPVSYFFTSQAGFTPKSIMDDVKNLCKRANVKFEDFSDLE